jgi:hypothetical protein
VSTKEPGQRNSQPDAAGAEEVAEQQQERRDNLMMHVLGEAVANEKQN